MIGWNTKNEIQYLNSIGTHAYTKQTRPPGFRLQCLRGYVEALKTYRRRWGSLVNSELVEAHAKKLLQDAT